MTNIVPEGRPLSRREARERELAAAQQGVAAAAPADPGPTEPAAAGPGAVLGSPTPAAPPTTTQAAPGTPTTPAVPVRTSARTLASAPPPAKTPPSAIPARPVTGLAPIVAEAFAQHPESASQLVETAGESASDVAAPAPLAVGATPAELAVVPAEAPTSAPAFEPVTGLTGLNVAQVTGLAPPPVAAEPLAEGLVEERQRSYTWLHYLVLVAVAFVLGLLLWQLIDQDRAAPTEETETSPAAIGSTLPECYYRPDRGVSW